MEKPALDVTLIERFEQFTELCLRLCRWYLILVLMRTGVLSKSVMFWLVHGVSINNVFNCLFYLINAFFFGLYRSIEPVDYIHGINGKYNFGETLCVKTLSDFIFLFRQVNKL